MGIARTIKNSKEEIMFNFFGNIFRNTRRSQQWLKLRNEGMIYENRTSKGFLQSWNTIKRHYRHGSTAFLGNL